MPVQVMSRHNRTQSTMNHFVTPVRSTSRATTESSIVYSPTVTSGGQQPKLNVVTRVAIEGKAKQGQDGASIKMYLKMSIPLDSVVPGSTIALFPEENVKILTSQVHPIDNNSVPYNFSSSSSPLLHNAARALNLPGRSPETFYSAFNLSQPQPSASVSSSRSSKADTNTESMSPVDPQFTGHILVSGYNISYVLPKWFPHSRGNVSRTELEPEDLSHSPYRMRRTSISEKNTAQFIAAIDMWVPFVSRPPRAPYLLSIPTPRCLHNHIKLRIFPPSNASTSYASLSSIEDESNSWDLTSDPHVTRNTSARLSRSKSYTHFADDESSDSSTTGFSEGCGLRGTFPSAERVRIRWAKPIKTIDIPGQESDGRRRVGVKEVKGEMTCVIQKRLKDCESSKADSIQMYLEYRGTCKGVWFPGVATLLGMDVSLEAKGSEVSWLDETSSHWEVNGGPGYTGFNVNAGPPLNLTSRTSSFDSDSSQVRPHSAKAESLLPRPVTNRSLSSQSTGSTHSLLRAPLPTQHVGDYSFENSHGNFLDSSSPLGTMSSVSSVPASASMDLSCIPSPVVPVTLHINMNELLPPAKNVLSFTISGTIVVKPRNFKTSQDSYGSDDEKTDSLPIVLPRFTVLAADSETTTIVVRNEVVGDTTAVEVYNPTGNIYKDPQSRKTVLRKGGFTRCGDEGGRISLKDLRPTTIERNNSPGTPHTPTGKIMLSADMPTMISNAEITITPLLSRDLRLPCSYAVSMKVDSPANSNSDWLEFGLARTSNDTTNKPQPHVQVISARVDGRAAKHEKRISVKDNSDAKTDTHIPFENMSEKEWSAWIKIFTGRDSGKPVIIDYVVHENHHPVPKGLYYWTRRYLATELQLMHILLPAFTLPVGRFEARLDLSTSLDISTAECNLPYHKPTEHGQIFLHHSVEEYFSPQMQVVLRRKEKASGPSRPSFRKYFFLTWTLILLCFVMLYRLGVPMNKTETFTEDLQATSMMTLPDELPTPTTTTTTATVYTTIFIPPSISCESSRSTSQVELKPPLPTGDPDPSSPMRGTEIPHDRSPPEEYGLIPLTQTFDFSWIHWEKAQESIQTGLEKVVETMEVVWQFFRKAYHYPLDPP